MLSCVAICRLQLYREKSVFVISSIALHIDRTALSDGTYDRAVLSICNAIDEITYR